MAHKLSLEALDRTLRDLWNSQELFGGILILLAGDFRQTLPVLPRSTMADEINACLKCSFLWRYVKTLKLRENIRVLRQNDPSANVFAKQLLDIGNGVFPVDEMKLITFPTDFCTIVESKETLIESVFPNIVQQFRNRDWLSVRAILAPTNKDVNELNANYSS